MSTSIQWMYKIFVMVNVFEMIEGNQFLSCNKYWFPNRTEFIEMRNCMLRLANIEEVSKNIRSPFPFMVSIRHYTQGQVCSGAVVGKRWILTSSLCFENKDHPETFEDANMFIIKDATGQEIIPYGSYDTMPRRQTLLKVDKDINIRPVIIEGFNIAATDVCSVLFVDHFRMHEIELPVLDNDNCNNLMKNVDLADNICFYIPADGQCMKDAIPHNNKGASIFCGNKISAIVHGPADCDEEDKPITYERIKHHWVRSVINKSREVSGLRSSVSDQFQINKNLILFYICHFATFIYT